MCPSLDFVGTNGKYCKSHVYSNKIPEYKTSYTTVYSPVLNPCSSGWSINYNNLTCNRKIIRTINKGSCGIGGWAGHSETLNSYYCLRSKSGANGLYGRYYGGYRTEYKLTASPNCYWGRGLTTLHAVHSQDYVYIYGFGGWGRYNRTFTLYCRSQSIQSNKISISKLCPSSFSYKNNKCQKINSNTYISKYVCPSGYEKATHGNRCSKTILTEIK
jgi:hypothetical protein